MRIPPSHPAIKTGSAIAGCCQGMSKKTSSLDGHSIDSM